MDWLAYLNNLINHVINLLNPTWPQTTIILFLIFIFKFKNNIARLLERMNKVSKEGISFGQIEEQVVPPSTVDEAKNKTEQISKRHSFITLTQSISGISEYINKLTDDDHKKIEILTNELAETFFNLRCQSIYNSIFGSQIYLLKILNSHKPDGLNENRIEAYFNDIAQKYPDFFATWTCEMYLNFLRQSILITTNKNNFCITEFGVDFLVWLQLTGFPESKAL
ncbi:TPA: hypothetical protein GDD06_08915 [Legionella pneumophila]|nr:hypothetical protein [Legionella pneumophila]